MSALVIALDQPVVTGLVFLLWDMVLLAVFIAGTTRLASYLTKKDMEHGTAVTPKELEVPHVSGGIGSSKPVTQISIICARAAFIIAIFISQFFIEGSTRREGGTLLASEGALVRGVPENITNSSLLLACIFANETSRIFHPSYRLNGKAVCDEKRDATNGFFYIDTHSVFGGALATANVTGFKVIGSTSSPRGSSDFVKTLVDSGDPDWAPTIVCINGSDSYDFQTSSYGTRTRIPCVSIVDQPARRLAVVLWNTLDEPSLEPSTTSLRMVSRTGITMGIRDPPDHGELASAIIRNWLFNDLLAQDAVAASLLIELSNATVPRLEYESVTEISTVGLVMLSLCLIAAFVAVLFLLFIPKSTYEVNTYNGLARAAWQATFGSADGDYGRLELHREPSSEAVEVYGWKRNSDEGSKLDDESIKQVDVTLHEEDKSDSDGYSSEDVDLEEHYA